MKNSEKMNGKLWNGNITFNNKVYPCVVSLTMDLTGGKWKTVILYYLKEKKKRFSTLRREIPDITDMTLSLQLKSLIEDGLVKKKVFGKKPPLKVEYELTDMGKSFIPVLGAITNWGKKVSMEMGELVD